MIKQYLKCNLHDNFSKIFISLIIPTFVGLQRAIFSGFLSVNCRIL